MKTEADWQSIAREEMRFFGSVSAAISHEINNRFAVINEKAGLLQDLAGMMAVSYTHLTLPTMSTTCRSRWSAYH